MKEKNKKTRTLILLLALVSLMFIAFSYRHTIKRKVHYYYTVLKNRITRKENFSCNNCNDLFNDNVKTHQIAYANESITPQNNDEGLNRLFRKGVLKNIESNESYLVRKLDHSKPLLMKKAVLFLDKLSISYNQKCKMSQLYYIPFEITSATRTIQSVGKLSKSNNNAIENSAHLRGKTFDISYRAFSGYEKQLDLFISALNELKQQNKCYVKYERNGCLHITVN
jgi:uncharacterized protein YcbK (DUF882 family)